MTRESRWSRRTVVALVIAIGLVGVSMGAFAYLSLAPSPRAQVQVELTIVQNATSGAYQFSPQTIRVPAGALVEMRITNYDPMNHSVEPIYCDVTGTTDGMMDAWGGGMGSMMSQRMRGLPPGAIGHTFSIQGPGYDLNVPIPPASSSGAPSVVTFSFVSHGSTAWSCMAEMSSVLGKMMGSFDTS
jgi:hypothetical protein